MQAAGAAASASDAFVEEMARETLKKLKTKRKVKRRRRRKKKSVDVTNEGVGVDDALHE